MPTNTREHCYDTVWSSREAHHNHELNSRIARLSTHKIGVGFGRFRVCTDGFPKASADLHSPSLGKPRCVEPRPLLSFTASLCVL